MSGNMTNKSIKPFQNDFPRVIEPDNSTIDEYSEKNDDCYTEKYEKQETEQIIDNSAAHVKLFTNGEFGAPLPPNVTEEVNDEFLPPVPPVEDSNPQTKRESAGNRRRSEIMGQQKFVGADGTHCFFNLKVIFEPYRTG